MKKLISVLLTLCMTLSLLGGAIVFESSAVDYETVKLVGFDDWTQDELNTSSGNNGYANGCTTALTVVTDKQYIVGGASQAIKAVFGTGSFNNAIVNWKYQTGGPCTDGNVWAVEGTAVNFGEYDGIRMAILNSEGKPANFTKVTLRLTNGWNYSNNMRYWEGVPVKDDDGWFYFDFASFKNAGSPSGTDIYDYAQNFAKGISMLNNGGDAENTCYYSTVELYKQGGGVSKIQLNQYIARIKNVDSKIYAKEIAAAEAVANSDAVTQAEVDEQVRIIDSCISDWKNHKFSTYSFAQLKGIQEWTSENAANMNGYGSVYEVSDKGTLGAAKQSIKLTTNKNSRYCFANSAKDGSFFGNPYEFVNAEDGKLSDYDGIAIAFTDENGKPIQFSQFTARLMRNKSDWDNYWVYESIFTDMDVTCLNGYYFIPFSAYSALSGEAVNDLSIMSVLWYKDLASGETAYISDMLAYKEGDVATDANGYTKTLIPGFNSFTSDELSKMAVRNGKLSFAKQGDETVINLLETADNGWGSYTVEFATASTAEQSSKNPLINGKSFFGGVELANKAGMRFKIVNTGAEGTSPFNGEVSFCFGSSHRYIAVDYKGMYPDEDGYYTVDWSTLGKKWGQEILWTDWYTDFTEITGAYDKGIDMVKMVFVGKKGETYSFYIDDIYAYSAGDASDLYETIKVAKEENVSQELIDEAMDIYLDCTASQDKIDAINQKILDAMDEELIAIKAYKEELDKLLNEGYDNGLDAEYDDLLLAADLVYSSLDSTVDQLGYYVNELREKVTLSLVDDAYADILTKAFYAWEYNYTADSWAKFAPLAAAIFPIYDTATAEDYAALEAAYNALVLANTVANDELLFDDWSTEDVNAVVDANSDRLCDSIGKGHNGLFLGGNDWNGGDFSNNTIYEAADGSFSMTALVDFLDGSIGWKNMDRSKTLSSTGAYPTLNVAGLNECEGLRVKIDVDGYADRILIGLSNCETMMEESYALNINPESIGADGYINIPFSYFEKAFWANPISNPENAIVFIVEVYGVTEGTTVTFSDVRGYNVLNYTIPTLWEYNYTAESWAAYEAAIASVASQEDVDAAVALLVAYPTAAVTGNLFEGWTNESINAVVNENGASQLKDSIGDGLNTNGVWNAGDFSNNTVFGGTDNFFMTATADFAGKSMGWKNLDRSGNLSGASMLPYPVLNGAENLIGAEGLRFKLEVTGGTAERLLIGLSNCYRGNGTREMYALNIKPEYADAEGYINIPFTAFEKAWWTEAFAADELDEVLVFIVEAYGVSNGTTITISDVRGYQEGSLVYPEIWEYNYTAESLAAYKAAVAAAKAQFEVDAAKALLVSAPTAATTGNLFEGWTTENVNEVFEANKVKPDGGNNVADSISSDALDTEGTWKPADFTNNTTFAANNSFSITATKDNLNGTIGWKNMDRSGSLGNKTGAYPELNVKGLNDAEGLRMKIEVEGTVERLLIGLSNCATMVQESYALNIKPEYVDADGYINIPFSYFQKAWWCAAVNPPENAIVFIVEALGATEGTTITFSDVHGYKYFFATTADEVAKVAKLADNLEAFDVLGRYTDLIAEARAVVEGTDKDVYEAVYAEIFAVLKGYGDAASAIVDVPGYSVYTQEELNQFGFRDNVSTGSITKVDGGIKIVYGTTAKGEKCYQMVNGTYAGNGFEGEYAGQLDVAYGAIAPINGKTLVDMLGGYSLADIYAYRFKIENGSSYVIMNYKDGVGLWNGMVSDKHTAYIDGGYYTFKTGSIPTGMFDGWYCGSFSRDQIRENAKFLLADFSDNQNKTVYGWQVILFETIDRSALKALLTDEANAGADWYEEAVELYYDADASAEDIEWFVIDLEYNKALEATENLWQYNYTADSWAAYEAALADAEYAADVEAAIALLEILEGEAVTDNLFEGWTDEAINAVVNANGEGQLKPSIGDGTNTGWNAGDFSLNTTFGGTDGFFMTATADFVNGSMGWKNLDRSGTLADAAMGGYPVLNDATSLVKAEGLRIKLNVTGDVERILIGLSNCQRPNGVREMYALNVKPEYVAADGYINIPFSYFEKAFWCDAFAQDELDETIVFIIEAYNVASGSTVAIEDIYGYSTKTFGAENEAKADALAAEIEAYDFLGYYDAVVADLKALSADDYYYGAMATLEEAEAANFVPAYDNLDDLKAAIQALDAELPAVVEAINVYYAPASQDAVDAAVLALTKIINTPDAPVLGLSSTDSTITVDPIEGVEYRINGGEWTTDNVFTGLAANTYHTVEARYAETATANASEITAIVMATELGSFGGASVVISGVERYLGTLTAEVIDFPEYLGSYSVVWYNAAGEVVGEGAELVIDAALIGTQVYAVVTSVNATDIVTSETSGIIGKALITEYTLPTASAIQYPQTLGDSVLSDGVVEGITGTWAWVTPNAQPLSSQSGTAFDVTFTPDEEFAALYEVLNVKVAVIVEAAPYEPDTKDGNGFEVYGEFMKDAVMNVEDISIDMQAYLALLRAASKDESGYRNLILFKNVTFTVNGEAVDEIYDGALTVTSFIGEARANETITVWFFVDGAPVSYTGTVDANGILTVDGVIL